MKILKHFFKLLEQFSGPPNPESVPDDGKLKSEMMIKDNRRYYLDLKENARGRFLRVNALQRREVSNHLIEHFFHRYPKLFQGADHDHKLPFQLRV